MQARIFFTDSFRSSPMTFWVHETWLEHAVTYPAPSPLGGKGFANYLVRTGGFPFRFSSLEELRVCIDTLSRKHLDNPIQKGAMDSTDHWLNKLPPRLKRWERRARIVEDLRRAMAQFQRETGRRPMPPNPRGDHRRRLDQYAQMLVQDEEGRWLNMPHGEYVRRQQARHSPGEEGPHE
jgi:hypothetical protein